MWAVRTDSPPQGPSFYMLPSPKIYPFFLTTKRTPKVTVVVSLAEYPRYALGPPRQHALALLMKPERDPLFSIGELLYRFGISCVNLPPP